MWPNLSPVGDTAGQHGKTLAWYPYWNRRRTPCFLRNMATWQHRQALQKFLLIWALRQTAKRAQCRVWWAVRVPTLQLTSLSERANWKFVRQRPTGAVFLDVAEGVDILRVRSLLYIYIIPNFLFNLVGTTPSPRTSQTSFQSITSTRHSLQSSVVQGGLVSPVPFSLYVKDTPTHSRNVDLALCADDTAPTITSEIRRCSSITWRLISTDFKHWLLDGYRHLKENHCALCWVCETRPKAQTSSAFRADVRVDRNNTVPLRDPWC
jgi:hypothetical protein